MRRLVVVRTIILVGVFALLISRMAGAETPVFKPNYDESQVPDYTLPDPLVMLDGAKVTDPSTWRRQRRPEILELFRTHVYGRSPGKPTNLSFEVFDLEKQARIGTDGGATGGLSASASSTTGGTNPTATRKQVTVFLQGKPDGAAMDVLMYLPNDVPRPVPVFLILNFSGNHAVQPDPAIRLSTRWMRPKYPGVVDNRATEKARGTAKERYPVDQILARGYGLATIYCGDIDPDFDDGFKNGIHGALDPAEADSKRPADAWGTIAAWAWGLSRAMDFFETDADVDHRRVAVLGHSRLGKTALWAGAEDERFAMVISNNSGCGGAALSRRCYGETVWRINNSFPHWFCENFKQYGEHESELPIDQHMLIALIAPRPVYVASADEDRWADPKGEFLAARHANPVYQLLGKDGMASLEMPGLEQPVMSTIGYHMRRGGHSLTEYDWQRYMDFADKHLPRR
jgi:hypothetical protein